jgi:hypothetical protein
MKVHEKDFSRAIIIVKNCYIEATQTLIFELHELFPKQEVMMTLGIVDFQYWLNPTIVKGSFFFHLNVIKSTFCYVDRIVDGIMVPPLSDSHKLDVQSFCFRLTMSHNVKGEMVEHL